MSKRISFVECLIVLVIIGIIAYLALPTGKASNVEKAKLTQLVDPINFHEQETKLVLLSIATSAKIPIKFHLCKTVAEKRITVQTDRVMSMGNMLTVIAQIVGTELKLQTGQHGELVRPTFLCGDPQGEYVTIEKGI